MRSCILKWWPDLLLWNCIYMTMLQTKYSYLLTPELCTFHQLSRAVIENRWFYCRTLQYCSIACSINIDFSNCIAWLIGFLFGFGCYKDAVLRTDDHRIERNLLLLISNIMLEFFFYINSIYFFIVALMWDCAGTSAQYLVETTWHLCTDTSWHLQ